ncbi:MAG: hypothetical protein RLZZ535_2668 [Cyanobacteriota bacterium]|jgi:thioredoxin reductase (NADPH)
MTQLIDRTSNQKAFPKLSEDKIAELSQFGESQSFSNGQTLIKAGEKEFNFYMIKSGEVEIIDRSSGEVKVLTKLRVNEFVGDLANFKGSPANCSVVAKGECQVQAISAEELKKIINENSGLSDLILQTFIARREALRKSDCIGLRVIGSTGCRNTFRICNFLDKNHIEFNWIDTESDLEVEDILQHFKSRTAELESMAKSETLVAKINLPALLCSRSSCC